MINSLPNRKIPKDWEIIEGDLVDMGIRLTHAPDPGTIPEGWVLHSRPAGEDVSTREEKKAILQVALMLEMLIGALDGFKFPRDETTFVEWETNVRAQLEEHVGLMPPDGWPVAVRRSAYRRMLVAITRGGTAGD